MGVQVQALSSKFQQASDQLIAAIESCPDEKWQAKTDAEGWSVGVTAHHAADGISGTTGLLMAMATGQPLPPLTPEMLNAGNAQHARQHAGCTKAETLELARQNTAAAVGMIGSLNDDQLNTTGTLPLFAGQTVTAAQWGDMVVVGHLQQHLQSMQSAG